MNKYIYRFEEGSKEMKPLLGGKGANLAEMSSIGLPVPPGFTITTEACIDYLENDETLNQKLKENIFSEMKELEKKNKKSWVIIKTRYLFLLGLVRFFLCRE